MKEVEGNSGKNSLYYVVIFITNMCIMILELVGSRMINPYLGNNIIVWTSIIGIIMASMTLGYYWGGRQADKNKKMSYIVVLFNVSALYIVGVSLLHKNILLLIASANHIPLVGKALLSSFVLFVVPCFILSSLSPFIAHKILEKSNDGKNIGKLYAVGSVGSIVGTFLGGFILVLFIKTTNIFLIIGFILVLLSILLLEHKRHSYKQIMELCVICVLFAYITVHDTTIQTMYNDVTIYDFTLDKKNMRALAVSRDVFQSLVSIDDPYHLEFKYLQIVADSLFDETTNKVLFLGGAGFTLTNYLNRKYYHIKQDIVEIDPAFKDIAKKYMYFVETVHNRIIHEDARYFVNITALNKESVYDVVFQDVFMAGSSIPSYLLTKEYFEAIRANLVYEGIFAMNVIAKPESVYIQNICGTLEAVFGNIKVFVVKDSGSEYVGQNILVYASSNGDSLNKISGENVFAVKKNGFVYTDEYATVDWDYFR